MGLAASQARFLAITSRKLNCEFQSMQIAQDKLSITRAQQTAAQRYQNSLNASKLVWDGDNNGDGLGDVYDLSYDIMMRPSALNEYDAFLITDTQGRIVLSESMFQAAFKAGVINKDGSPAGSFYMGDAASKLATSDGSRNAFLYQLGVYNQIDAGTIDSIVNLGEKGYTKSGVGGEIIDKTLANAMNTNKFIDYLSSNYTEDSPEGVTPPYKKGDPIYGLNLASLFADGDKNGEITDEEFLKTFCTTTSPSNTDKAPSIKDGKNVGGSNGQILITKDGIALDREALKKLTLGDLLTGKYEMTYIGESKDMEEKASALLDHIAKALGMGSNYEVKGLNVDNVSNEALNQANIFGKSLLNAQNNTTTSGSSNYDSIQKALKKSQETNGIVNSNRNISSVSLTNMLKSFLTNFAIAIDGFDSGYLVEENSSKKSDYVTDDVGYYFVIKNDSAMTEQAMLHADFYNQLYNQLCMFGACSDSTKRAQVTDPNYLGHALKNGQLFVSTLNTDGYFYQGHYTASAHIAEVPDEDAIAQAEAEFEITKAQLSYKEESLDIKLKNIDTELAALSSEYDTVKNLISKNVEKVFTMFSS